ncbi:peptidoglycan-N-acetylglucosamine deacetylase [mine drainage metagenome]|uniref:Peptidoglycan-N-acetylglucosamine deacetylase n=1 Tax=mine drainage metagenome TaxID=410659 RepID=A0A1J5SEZ3_9ZZZZ
MYLVKTPWWLRALYPSFTWKINTVEKVLYLTFDDGPHETATPFVLDELKKHHAKATFFCIGKNVKKHKEIYKRIIEEGHAVGNHTYHHLNGWKTNDEEYINDIEMASKEIDSKLFRPPYGKITRFQSSIVKHQSSIIMWDVLSGDFDVNLQPQRCLANVLYHSKKGSIIVFHDSTKAWERMSFALPKVLEYFSKEGYQFRPL